MNPYFLDGRMRNRAFAVSRSLHTFQSPHDPECGASRHAAHQGGTDSAPNISLPVYATIRVRDENRLGSHMVRSLLVAAPVI